MKKFWAVLFLSTQIVPNIIHSDIKPSELRICDALGREVYKKDEVGSLQDQVVDMSRFAPGHYFVSIDNGDGVIWRKVIKE